MWSNLINLKSRHKLTLVAMGHQIGSFSDQALNGSEKDPVFFDVQHFTGRRGTASDLECNICKTPCNQHGKPCRNKHVNMLDCAGHCWVVLGYILWVAEGSPHAQVFTSLHEAQAEPDAPSLCSSAVLSRCRMGLFCCVFCLRKILPACKYFLGTGPSRGIAQAMDPETIFLKSW